MMAKTKDKMMESQWKKPMKLQARFGPHAHQSPQPDIALKTAVHTKCRSLTSDAKGTRHLHSLDVQYFVPPIKLTNRGNLITWESVCTPSMYGQNATLPQHEKGFADQPSDARSESHR